MFILKTIKALTITIRATIIGQFFSESTDRKTTIALITEKSNYSQVYITKEKAL